MIKKQIIIAIILGVFFIGIVSATGTISNLQLSESFSNSFAGEEKTIKFNFDYLDEELNYNGSQLIIKFSVNSLDDNYPVWEEDFGLRANVRERSVFLDFFEKDVDLQCNEVGDIELNRERGTGELYIIENQDNGTFYCYDPEAYLMSLDSHQEITLGVSSEQNLYPGNYNFSIELLELEPTDFSMLKIYFGRRDCTEENEWCNGADVNKNGDVDLDDFVIFKNNHERIGCTEAEGWCYGADINKDGRVDSIEFYNPRILVWNYNGTECIPSIIYNKSKTNSDYLSVDECNAANAPTKTLNTGGSGGARRYYQCGNGICEAGESPETCSQDCVETQIFAASSQGDSEDPEEIIKLIPEDQKVISEEPTGFFSTITGAVTGTLGTAGSWIALVFLVGLVGSVVAVRQIRKRNK